MSKTKCEKCAYIQDSPLEDMALISSKRLKEELLGISIGITLDY